MLYRGVAATSAVDSTEFTLPLVSTAFQDDHVLPVLGAHTNKDVTPFDVYGLTSSKICSAFYYGGGSPGCIWTTSKTYGYTYDPSAYGELGGFEGAAGAACVYGFDLEGSIPSVFTTFYNQDPLTPPYWNEFPVPAGSYVVYQIAAYSYYPPGLNVGSPPSLPGLLFVDGADSGLGSNTGGIGGVYQDMMANVSVFFCEDATVVSAGSIIDSANMLAWAIRWTVIPPAPSVGGNRLVFGGLGFSVPNGGG